MRYCSICRGYQSVRLNKRAGKVSLLRAGSKAKGAEDVLVYNAGEQPGFCNPEQNAGDHELGVCFDERHQRPGPSDKLISRAKVKEEKMGAYIMIPQATVIPGRHLSIASQVHREVSGYAGVP